jgi:hypothetical protein
MKASFASIAAAIETSSGEAKPMLCHWGGETGGPNPRMPRVMTRALRTATKGLVTAAAKVRIVRSLSLFSNGVLTEGRPLRGE